MHEITRFAREGVEVEFEKIEGGWLISVPAAARKLGYKRPDELRRLIQRNRDRFRATEVRDVKLTSRDGIARTTQCLDGREQGRLALARPAAPSPGALPAANSNDTPAQPE